MSSVPCYRVNELDAQILGTEKMSDQEIYVDFSAHIFKTPLPAARRYLRNYLKYSRRLLPRRYRQGGDELSKYKYD